MNSNDSTRLYTKLVQDSIKAKNELTQDSIREIKKLYTEAANKIIGKIPQSSGQMTKAWMSDYEKYLRYQINLLDKKLIKLTSGTINKTAELAADVDGSFFDFINGKYELDIDKEMLDVIYSVDTKVINRIIRGSFYKDNKSISERIWSYGNKEFENVKSILLQGMAEQKGYVEVMKDLEGYINPSSRRTFNMSSIGLSGNQKVDFNAMRLVRTSTTQIYQMQMIEKAKKNPFVEAIRWNLSAQHQERQIDRFGPDICDEYAKTDYNGIGVGLFKKNDVPVQHPMCLCYMTSEIPKDLDTIADELNKWIKGANNSKLDNYFRDKVS